MCFENKSSISSQAKRLIEENIEDIEKGDFAKLFKSAYDEGGLKLQLEIANTLCDIDQMNIKSIFDLKEEYNMNCFKFHPIGQGLFYTGSLLYNSYNFVYDCGGHSGQEYIDNSIEQYKNSMARCNQQKPDIDFVVISHLHEDHYNGISQLNKTFQIKRFYLPYIGDDKNFTALVLSGQFYKKNKTNSEYVQSLSSLHFMLSLYRIGEFADMQTELIGKSPSFEENGVAYQSSFFTSPFNCKDYWCFALFNKRVSDEKLQELTEKMYAVMGKHRVKSIYDLIIQGKFKEISEIYSETISKNLNITSTVLLHYPSVDFCEALYNRNLHNICDDPNVLNYRKHLYRGYSVPFKKSRFNATLLTGDVEMDKELANRIKANLPQEEIGVLQLPHHGASKNYRKLKGVAIESKTTVASYGLGNQYKHPSKETVDDLYNNRKAFYSANQYEIFDYIIE